MSSTSESLLVRIRDREDTDAWSRFVTLYTPLLFRWARQAGLDLHAAGDLSQDVLSVVLQKAGSFQYNPSGSFRGWLRKIAINQFRLYWRRRQRHELLAGESWIAQLPDRRSLESSWDASYRSELLRQAMGVLQPNFSPPIWQALQDWLLNSAESAEIVAQRYGVNVWTLYAAKKRFFKRLRALLAGLFEE